MTAYRSICLCMTCLLLAGALLVPTAVSSAGEEIEQVAAAEAAAALATPPAAQATTLNSPWRRTAYGWEKMTDWPQPEDSIEPKPRPCFHPGLLAAFLLLASLGALLAGDPATAVAKPAG